MRALTEETVMSYSSTLASKLTLVEELIKSNAGKELKPSLVRLMATELLSGISTEHFKAKHGLTRSSAYAIMSEFHAIKNTSQAVSIATELHQDILNQYSQKQTNPVTEIAIMQAINLLLKEQLKGFKFVSVVFNVAQPVHAQKVYTYKTNLEVAQDDYVVVQSPDGKFETVRVVEVDVAATSQYEYKWIVAKLDLAPFEEVKAIEAEVKKILQETERKKLEALRTAQIKEELGEEGLEQVKKAVSRTRI